jgi:hypothetical protein
MSYWLALFAVAAGAWLCSKREDKSRARIGFVYLCLAISFVVVTVSWRFGSDRQFAFWKLKAIPSSAWAKMVSDLKEMGRQCAESGVQSISSQRAMPSSFRFLGLREDYAGGTGDVLHSSGYTGPVASAVFGNKGRGWGLCVGPENFVRRQAESGYFFGCTKIFWEFFIGDFDTLGAPIRGGRASSLRVATGGGAR